MKVVYCEKFGSHEELEIRDIDPPGPPQAGQVKIDIRSRGIQFSDLVRIAGDYQDKGGMPFVVGGEAAGIVREVGADVTGVSVGDRVLTPGGCVDALLDALRDGRREPAAVEQRIAGLVQARLALERRRVGEAKDEVYGSQMDKLERRLSKLNDALERTEERLSAGLLPGVDTGASSAFRSVQGLSRDEPQYELKRDLMAQIFQANLELARWATGHGA